MAKSYIKVTVQDEATGTNVEKLFEEGTGSIVEMILVTDTIVEMIPVTDITATAKQLQSIEVLCKLMYYENRIALISVVRNLTGWDLRKAKLIVDFAAAHCGMDTSFWSKPPMEQERIRHR